MDSRWLKHCKNKDMLANVGERDRALQTYRPQVAYKGLVVRCTASGR